jgi:hypothetical protein
VSVDAGDGGTDNAGDWDKRDDEEGEEFHNHRGWGEMRLSRQTREVRKVLICELPTAEARGLQVD